MPNFCPNCGYQLTDKPPTTRMIVDESFMLTFGKHAGSTIGEVLKENPAYLFWINGNIEHLEVPDSILAQANFKKKPTPAPGWKNAPEPDYHYDDHDDDIPF